ncbi:MAG: fibronectin type III domain-containing protein [Candidatus Limnocylindrales bacterium]
MRVGVSWYLRLVTAGIAAAYVFGVTAAGASAAGMMATTGSRVVAPQHGARVHVMDLGAITPAIAARTASIGAPRPAGSGWAPRPIGTASRAPRLSPGAGTQPAGAGTQPSGTQPGQHVAVSLGGRTIPTPIAPGSSVAPTVAFAFGGLTQAESGAEPPDGWVAVNATSVVASVNGAVRIYDRVGDPLQTTPTWAFFGVPVGQEESDPRILWDAWHDRWVGSIVSKNPDFSANFIYLVVSETADPLGAWDRFAFPSGGILPDQPTIASSTDKIVITANDFRGAGAFLGAAILAIDWVTVIAGGPLAFVWTDADSSLFSIRPAQVLSPSPDVHLIAEDAVGATPDVMYKVLSGPATAATTSGFIDLTTGPAAVAAFSIPPAPRQAGGDTISLAVDERPLDAVWRNGILWFVATAATTTTSGPADAARYTQLDTSTAVPTAPADFIVTAPGVDVYTPGLTLSADGTLFASFSTSSPTLNPDIEFATWTAAGGLSVPQVLDRSAAPYAGERWGDYAGIAADVVGSGAVWMVGEVVAADGTWVTDIARLTADATAPPVPSRPIVATILAPATLATDTSAASSSFAVRLTWGPAADPTSGVATYQVDEDIDGTGFFTIGQVTGLGLTHTILLGHTYRFQVRAVDAAGNVGANATVTPVTPILYEQTTHVAYSGAWKSATSARASGGSTRMTTAPGATATFTFVGSAVAFLSAMGPSSGSVRLYVDGRYVGTRSLYLAAPRNRQLVYATAWPSAGTHRLQVVTVGTARHPRVDIDGFVVLR